MFYRKWKSYFHKIGNVKGVNYPTIRDARGYYSGRTPPKTWIILAKNAGCLLYITKQLQKECEDVLTGIGSFHGMFSLQVKLDIKPYQVPPWHIAYALQKPFKEELERVQQQDIITPLGIEQMAEWYNSFILVPKSSGKTQPSAYKAGP